MFSPTIVLLAAAGAVAAVQEPRQPAAPLPHPSPVVTGDVRANEKPVETQVEWSVVEENSFFKRKKAAITFKNPNSRVMSGELEFQIPDGAYVCGYELEVNGEMVPGVVCEKEKARVAFENEKRKGVDPGLVEHVKGNVWKTRIFPLNPGVVRKAGIEIVMQDVPQDASGTVYERDGGDVFAACATDAAGGGETVAQKIAAFEKGTIVWDASMSSKPFAAAWRKKLEGLPGKGEWALVVFRNDVQSYAKTYGFTKEMLLNTIDGIVYDGGTDIAAALECLSNPADFPRPALLFTDEIDTLGLEAPKYEEMAGVTVASRDDAPARAIEVRKLAKDEKIPDGAAVKESGLLATVWAARRMQDLASQADTRKDEFLALGRRYGVAGPGLSLIVLESLDQWLQYKIEPPANLAIHDEWVRRRAAEDDPIADRKAKAEHEQLLLKYWEERVKWWNDPKPPRKTPKSGLFDNIVGRRSARSALGNSAADSLAAPMAMAAEEMDAPAEAMVASAHGAAFGAVPEPQEAVAASSAMMRMRSAERMEKTAAKAPGAAGSAAAPTVTLKAWDPKTPYIDAIKAAPKGEAYRVYLKEREAHGSSPAFYIDCAGWFYKAGMVLEADRILSNLAEFKLEDAALWRSMGWRAREAGRYGCAVRAFRKALALRGEEAQSRRDLALVLMEDAKDLLCDGDWERVRKADEQLISLRNFNNPADTPESRLKARLETARRELEEAMKLFADAAFNVSSRRSGRRDNDFQVSIIALEELNGLIAWVDDVKWPDGVKPAVPEFDAAYRRDLPVKLRIVMSWDADETDIDIHVLEPNGEEAYYSNRRTAEGGFVSEDVTTGYGPEEYMKKELESGTYKVLSNYFSSHQTALTGATTVTATVYTDWGTAQEKRQVMTMRLDKPKDKHFIGEITL